jgi:hypothetical protein
VVATAIAERPLPAVAVAESGVINGITPDTLSTESAPILRQVWDSLRHRRTGSLDRSRGETSHPLYMTSVLSLGKGDCKGETPAKSRWSPSGSVEVRGWPLWA